MTRLVLAGVVAVGVGALTPAASTAQHTHQDGPAVAPTVVGLNAACPSGTFAVNFTKAEIQDGTTGTNKHVNVVMQESEAIEDDTSRPHRTEIRVWRDPAGDENDPDPDPTEPANGIRFDLDQPADGTYTAEIREVHVRGAASANRYSYAAFAGGGTEHDDELTAPGGGNFDYPNGVRVCMFTLAPAFADTDGSIFKNDIAWLASVGVTGGCATNPLRYCPTQNVTRAQMASFLVRALEIPPTNQDFFTDDETSIHERDINALAKAGITGGCGGTRYCPGASVTRAQMASFLVRAFEIAPSSQDKFTDDNTSIHENDINALAKAGVTGGCTATTYCPSSAVTRGQMAAFIRRAAQ